MREVLYLKTNDPTSPTLPVLVTGEVQAVLSVSPAKLNVGSVAVGTAVTRKVILRGGKAFRVLGVDGTGNGVTLDSELGAAASVQTLSFKCQPDQAGDFKRDLKIKTDIQDDPITVTVEGTAAK